MRQHICKRFLQYAGKSFRRTPCRKNFPACWVLLLLLPCLAPAQRANQPNLSNLFSRYTRYTMEQGLSNNTVKAMAQDDDGFLWFGTQEGLNRFDGERFTAFFQRADGRGLPHDNVLQIIALPGRQLLVGTKGGLCLLNTHTLEFKPLTLPRRPGEEKSDSTILILHRARDGQIWVGTGSGVHVLDKHLHAAQSYFEPLSPGQPSDNYFAQDFLELPDGTMAVKCRPSSALQFSLWQVIDFQKQKTEPLAQLLPGCALLDTAFYPNCTVTDGLNSIWYTALGTRSLSSLYQFDWAGRKSHPLLKNTYAPATQEPRQGQYYRPFLLPDSLLFLQRYFGPPLLYDLRNGSTTDLPQWKTSLPDGKAITTFLDRDSNLWLCPRAEGIYFLTLKNLPAIPMTALNEAHKKRMAVTKVSEEWFGFFCADFAGRWVVSSGNGGLYSMDKSGLGVAGHILDNPFQGYAYVTDFAPDRGDTLWTNTLSGLCWYDPVSNTQGSLKARFAGLDSLDNRFLYRDRHGLIWGRVHNNGVCAFDTRTRRLTHFPSKGKNPPFPILSATACSEGSDGDMWFGFGSEGKYLVRWRRATNVFEKVEPLCPPGLACTKVFNILADLHGNVWLYTDQQWFIMDSHTRQVQSFGKGNGLLTNDPEGLCFDRDGNAWVATSYGLSRFDPRNRQLRSFYQTDGLLSNTITNVELIDTAHNILFVSTDRGLCLFEPDKVGTAKPAPPTFITGLRVSDQSAAFPESGRLTLRYSQNDLRIEFTGVNFINGSANRYQYSMEREGHPDIWRDAGTDNFANFLNLAPGRYNFRARTANSDGKWGTETATLSVVIYPPWWRTWAFQFSLLAALAATGWAFYRRQIARTEAREKEKARVRQQLADLEMKALRSQMNPHFVFNALNSVQNFILKNDPREASKYLTKFARLMRLILENSESPMVSLAREIELLRYYTELEQLRFNHRFSFDFQIDSSLNSESVSIPGMLIQPHIENAIWHGLMHKTEPGHLWVRFLKTGENTLLCEVEDDGVGRVRTAEMEKDRPKNHRSTGLANIRHRLEVLNAQLAEDIRLEFQDLYDEAGTARGTCVRVRMPVV